MVLKIVNDKNGEMNRDQKWFVRERVVGAKTKEVNFALGTNSSKVL